MAIAPNSIPIVMLAGQSNALNSSVSLGVMNTVARHQGLFLQNAVNGSPLGSGSDTGTGDWSARNTAGAGELYRSLVAQIAAYLDPTSPTYVPGAYLAGIVWVQGEADTWSVQASQNYLSNLTTLNAALTSQFGSHEFVISGLSDHVGVLDNPASNRAANWDAVQAAQRSFDANTVHSTLIQPDLLAQHLGMAPSQIFRSDGLHYSTSFGPQLGAALAEAAFASAPKIAPTLAHPRITYQSGSSLDDDFLVSTSGWHSVFGAGGNDGLSLRTLGQAVQLIGSGDHILRVTDTNATHTLSIDLVSIERLFLTDQADRVALDGQTINIAAGAGDDTLFGSSLADKCWLDAGNDRFDGRAGDDTAYGGLGADRLFGGPGADRLFGGGGLDQLRGGTGADSLTGGAAADMFQFAPTEGHDQIMDFENGIDRIDLTRHHTTYASLKIATAGGDVIISMASGDSILLCHIDRAAINAADFLF